MEGGAPHGTLIYTKGEEYSLMLESPHYEGGGEFGGRPPSLARSVSTNAIHCLKSVQSFQIQHPKSSKQTPLL